MPPSAVTVSRISIAPASRTAAAISSIGCQAPVDVSAITIATTFGFTRASASFTSATVNTSPQGRSIFVTSPPARSAMSASRLPNTPLMQMSTRSPGSTRFVTVASCPADPVPLIAIVIRFFVQKTCCSIDCSSSMIFR